MIQLLEMTRQKSNAPTAVVCARALASHPDRTSTVTALLEALGSLPPKSKRPAVWAALTLTDNQDETVEGFVHHEDPQVREAVASLITLTENGEPARHGRALAADIDRKVQLAVLDQFEPEAQQASPELLSLLREIAAADPQPFECPSCGASNDATHESCVSCSVVTWKPPDRSRELLESLEANG